MKIFFFPFLPKERGGKWKHEILMSDDRKLQPLKTGMFFARITSTKQVDKWLYVLQFLEFHLMLFALSQIRCDESKQSVLSACGKASVSGTI
jgi:hypothetical protein